MTRRGPYYPPSTAPKVGSADVRRGQSRCFRSVGSPLLTFVVVALLLIAVDVRPAASQTQAEEIFHRIGTLHVPGNPLKSFDAGVVNGADRVYALADRSNHGVDLFDLRDDKFLGRIAGFSGPRSGHGSEAVGPNGLVAVGPQQLWAGDGDSSVKIVDLSTRKVVGVVSTGGTGRVDEMAYDSRDDLVVAANNEDKPPFVTFMSTTGDHRVAGRLALPQATDGLEQPVWDPSSGFVYLAVPELDGHSAQGGVAVIDPRTRELLRMIPVTQCMPAGLALGPDQQLLVGCSDDAVAAGFPAKSLLVKLPSGEVVRTFQQVGGSDEVWFDRKQDIYLLAAVANPGGPVLGVINAREDRWAVNVPTGLRAHSVAADGVTGQAFVPIAATSSDPQCHAGCIAMFATRHR